MESSCDLSGFLGCDYGTLQELRQEAKDLKLDLPDFPDYAGDEVPNSFFYWVNGVGASTRKQ